MLGLHYQSVSSKSSLTEGNQLKYAKLKKDIKTNHSNKFPEADQKFGIDELRRAIQNTHDSAPGLDGFKYKIFKEMSSSNLLALLQFYNIIWKTGVRPKSWNKSIVIPIKKCVNATYVHQTRPINLINTSVKLFDIMVNTRLMFILEQGNFLDNKQFGFRRNKQCLKSLMLLNNNIAKAFENKSHLHMISFDIKKAFDSVWPESVLVKL